MAGDPRPSMGQVENEGELVNRTCEQCQTTYDDLDHLTVCPHEWFPDVKEEPYKGALEAMMQEVGPVWIPEAVQRDIDQTGKPLLKQPEDLERYEKIIEFEQIELVIETGTWQGESARWFAERVPHVVTLDIKERYLELPENVTAVVTDSGTPRWSTLGSIARKAEGLRTLISLDAAHDARHVARELDTFAPLVTLGSYIVVEDTIHHWRKEFRGDDPLIATRFWMAGRKDFEIAPDYQLTMNPFGWLRRIRPVKEQP